MSVCHIDSVSVCHIDSVSVCHIDSVSVCHIDSVSVSHIDTVCIYIYTPVCVCNSSETDEIKIIYLYEGVFLPEHAQRGMLSDVYLQPYVQESLTTAVGVVVGGYYIIMKDWMSMHVRVSEKSH